MYLRAPLLALIGAPTMGLVAYSQAPPPTAPTATPPAEPQGVAAQAQDPTPTPTSARAPAPSPTPTVTPSPTPSPTPTPTPTPTPIPLLAGEVRLDILQGAEAAFMVREQLLGFDFPSNAVGVTQEVEGSLVLGADGAIQADRSKLTIDLRSLVSDEDRRDNFIRRRVLETGFYSLAVFVPTEARGLPFPLPTQGESSFQLVGEMTIHGTTSELVWEVTMTFTEDQVVGEATAEFPFGKFDMSPPRVRLVLSVDDLIRLRISFRMSMTQGTGAAPG